MLADALSERGDPRGEFITLQCQGSPAHGRRAVALLRHHWRDWCGTLSPLIDERTVRFERGFLRAVSLRRVPEWLQTQVDDEPWFPLVAEVTAEAGGAPDDKHLGAVLSRFSGLRRLTGLVFDELVAVLGAGPNLEELGTTLVDGRIVPLLLDAKLPRLRGLQLEALDQSPLVLPLLEHFTRLENVDVGRGSLVLWHRVLRERGLQTVQVHIPGWVLRLEGKGLAELGVWPQPAREDPMASLGAALMELPLDALTFIRVRGGRPPKPESIVALRRAARGTPMLLPASWRPPIDG